MEKGANNEKRANFDSSPLILLDIWLLSLAGFDIFITFFPFLSESSRFFVAKSARELKICHIVFIFLNMALVKIFKAVFCFLRHEKQQSNLKVSHFERAFISRDETLFYLEWLATAENLYHLSEEER